MKLPVVLLQRKKTPTAVLFSLTQSFNNLIFDSIVIRDLFSSESQELPGDTSFLLIRYSAAEPKNISRNS